MKRLSMALLVAFGLTAFAPAPFPRRVRAPEPELSLKALRGTWRIVSIHSTKPNGQHIPETFNGPDVRIAGDRWTFLPDNYPGANLDIAIDHTKKPAHVTFYCVPAANQRKPRGVGIIRRMGEEIQLLYTWSGEDQRPKAFDPAPEAYYLMTLKRK